MRRVDEFTLSSLDPQGLSCTPTPPLGFPNILLIFADRIEILSPGTLPNSLTIAQIKAGISNLRNPILASYAAKGLLPYRGLGSGIRRAIAAWPAIDLVDDRDRSQFQVMIRRPPLVTLP